MRLNHMLLLRLFFMSRHYDIVKNVITLLQLRVQPNKEKDEATVVPQLLYTMFIVMRKWGFSH